ncbi:MAG: TRL domain-containing protein [Pyrinomonadaceae bacterium]
MKQGESCATTYLGLFTDGSALISDAAKAGGLRKVDLVEYKMSSNPLFSRQCAVVYGQ